MTYNLKARKDGCNHLTRKCFRKVSNRCYYYYIQWNPGRAKFINHVKRQANKQVRLYKGEISKGGTYKRIYDVPWEID